MGHILRTVDDDGDLTPFVDLDFSVEGEPDIDYNVNWNDTIWRDLELAIEMQSGVVQEREVTGARGSLQIPSTEMLTIKEPGNMGTFIILSGNFKCFTFIFM